MSTQKMMYAAKTIVLPDGIPSQEALDYMIVYTRDLEGNWIDALTGQPVELPEYFDIDFKDLKPFDSVVVKTLEELKAALNEPDYKTIILGNDIKDINETLVINNTITLEGNGKTLSFKDLEKVNGVASGLVINADGTNVNDLTVSMPNISGHGKVNMQFKFMMQKTSY